MSNLNTSNTPLATIALYGSPEQLREKLESRKTPNVFESQCDLDPYSVEKTILDMMEYDKLFGTPFDRPENPFKMEIQIPEDTTNYNQITQNRDDEYMNAYYISENNYTTDNSELTEDSDSDGEFVSV